jgi:hypothetical protein
VAVARRQTFGVQSVYVFGLGHDSSLDASIKSLS